MPRGGARQGSGRKPGIINQKNLNIRISTENLEKIKENAKKNGMNVSEYIIDRCCKEDF